MGRTGHGLDSTGWQLTEVTSHTVNSLGSVRILLNVPRKISTFFVFACLLCFETQSRVPQIGLELIADGE